MSDFSSQVKSAASRQELFAGKTLVFQKNENSFLVPKIAPCNEEFFDQLFNHYFWEWYHSLRLGFIPFKSTYAFFFSSELYFCKNVENRFLGLLGSEKEFKIVGEKITEITPISIDSVLFTLAAPLELAKNAAHVSMAAFKINSTIHSFESFYQKSRSFWVENQFPNDPSKTAVEALNGALAAMQYSVFSSIASSLKMGLADGFATRENLLEQAILQAQSPDSKKTIADFGFFSMSPYDITKPTLAEDSSLIERLQSIPIPKGTHFILRENAKLCASMHLAVLRNCYLAVAKTSSLKMDVFFLRPSELSFAITNEAKATELSAERKQQFSQDLNETHPSEVAVVNGSLFMEKTPSNPIAITGQSVGVQKTVKGRLVFVTDSSEMGKVQTGDIIFSKGFSPELVVFYQKCVGVLSESGSLLSHSAIVAREQGIPCIVGLKGATLLREFALVEINGQTGQVQLLD